MILVTGGLGYIGSHTCVALLQGGYDVVILDDLSNSTATVAERIAAIAGRAPTFVQGDLLDSALLDDIFRQHKTDAVVHFAAAKAVGESVAEPLKYYRNNVAGTVSLLGAMTKAGVRTLVFSSSATVYGDASTLPIREDFPRSATSPYGRSKIMQEDIFTDVAHADSTWRIVSLRYFNPVGAHESGLIGEDPRGTPNNLMPYLLQVAIGRRDELSIFGGDYPTPDGTCIRDFIHVQDLADGHLAALKYLQANSGCIAVNLGAGKGVSVLDMCNAFERATNHKLPRKVVARRAGDVAACWSDPSLAKSLFGWQPRRDLLQMCRDAWNWQTKNPNGYGG
jgi:UDP-glucose 4-epimerase